jgi:steroid 5-alpha reductase family enzyme
MNISDFSNRQLLTNTMLFIWSIKSIFSYRSIKVILLSNFLEVLRVEIASKNIFRIFRLILKLSLFQFICFSSFISTNYLSGASHLNYLDLLGLVICLLGITLELKSEKHLKTLSFKKTRIVSTGPWAVSRHPNLIGIFLFFLGIQVIAFSAISSLWSIFGFLLLTFILFQNILPKIEKNLLLKLTEYKTYSETVPKIFYFK